MIRTDTIFLAGIFSQNGLNAMPPATPVIFVLDRLPGKVFSTVVMEIVPGTASGQLPIGAELLGATDIGDENGALVILKWPSGLETVIAVTGTVGSATAFSTDAGPMGLLAMVLLYLKMLGTYF
jgi:hypothetical protein